MKQNRFIIIRKCDIAKCDPGNITKKKKKKKKENKMGTRIANLNYLDTNKTSHSRTFMLN